VGYLEGELGSSQQGAPNKGTGSLSQRKAPHSTCDRASCSPEARALADEINASEWEEEGEGEVGKIDFQPPGWDRLSAIAAVRGMAKGSPNPGMPALLHQPSGPSSSTFWSEGMATETGFLIPKALSPASADAKATVASGCLDACVQTVAAGPAVSSSAQTVGLEAREASVQTEDRQSGPSGDGIKKAPVQTRETVVAPGAEWQGWSLVIMMLLWAMVFLWSHKEDRALWLEANEVSHDVLVELRVSAHGAIPWLQVVSYDLITWLQVDRVSLG
jgi:hypothetical protein